MIYIIDDGDIIKIEEDKKVKSEAKQEKKEPFDTDKLIFDLKKELDEKLNDKVDIKKPIVTDNSNTYSIFLDIKSAKINKSFLYHVPKYPDESMILEYAHKKAIDILIKS